MFQRTAVEMSDQRETPIKVIPCPLDFAELATAEQQQEARRIVDFPGVLIVDGVFDDSILDGLREGLSDQRRKFKDKFNHGLPASETFKSAYYEVGVRIRALSKALFGFDFPEKGNRSYRPMITENEPLHFDTYTVECGQSVVMSVLNFDVAPRVWNVGPSLREVFRNNLDDVTKMLSELAPGESLNMRLRDAAMRGIGPLRSGTPVNKIQFAPGAVWYANPKTLSHQVIYGGGAQFETWTLDAAACQCPKCEVQAAGLDVASLPKAELVAALR